MQGTLRDRKIDVFTINPRTTGEALYWKSIQENVHLSGKYNATGVLCFSGNDTYVDPWLAANHVAQSSKPLTPLVALNPITMPPYTAAKMISSLAYMYGAHTSLNLITGVSSRDRQVWGDELSHEERYERLDEYVTIVRMLLMERKPATFEGRYFRIRQAVLLPRLKEELFPEFFVAGHSDAAQRTAAKFSATQLRMLSPGLGADLPDGLHKVGVHFGVITRPSEEEAWRVAREKFPPDRMGEKMLEMTIRHTDSTWKLQLRGSLDSSIEPRKGFWLDPFRYFRSDCPFFVGSHQQAADVIAAHLAKGICCFVLDLLPEEEEFANAAAAFSLAYERASRMSLV